MTKEKFSEILRADRLTREDLKFLDGLIEEYPWFSIPRFLKLKGLNQNEIEVENEELAKTVVFSSDRSQLYTFVNDLGSTLRMSPLKAANELEFISDDEVDEVYLDDGELDEAEAKAIPEKDEADMEDPEVEDGVSTPVMDSIDEELEEIDEEEDEVIEEGVSESEKIEDVVVSGSETKEKIVNDQPGNKSNDLIRQFLSSEPGVIKADKETNLVGDISSNSVMEDDNFITDTLAKIYLKQGLHAKAIYAYERLSLKYPEKSAYFAAQIEKIKNLTNT